MNKESIEKQLRTWFSQITKKYTWLTIKFEFNESRGVFMVSFSPLNQIELSDEFNLDAMQFADDMNARYGNEAPLFTDDESLFSLSSNAEIIAARSFGSALHYSTSISVVPQRTTAGSWASSSVHTTASAGKNFRQTQTEASYAVAA
ncbi:MAG: hypothetical protein Q4F85_04090 [Prevotella sp.]|nr:hypothetical protein [Prevotella sp.]